MSKVVNYVDIQPNNPLTLQAAVPGMNVGAVILAVGSDGRSLEITINPDAGWKMEAYDPEVIDPNDKRKVMWIVVSHE